MGEHRAPYLHVIRDTAPDTAPDEASDIAVDEASRSEGAQGAETLDVGKEASSPSSGQPRSAGVEDGASSDAHGDAPPDASSPASQPLTQAVMYAAVGWLALCVERSAVAVDIQPIAERLYEVSAHYDDEHTDGIILRVRLEVEPGLVVRSTVEPVRP